MNTTETANLFASINYRDIINARQAQIMGLRRGIAGPSRELGEAAVYRGLTSQYLAAQIADEAGKYQEAYKTLGEADESLRETTVFASGLAHLRAEGIDPDDIPDSKEKLEKLVEAGTGIITAKRAERNLADIRARLTGTDGFFRRR